MPKKNIAKEKKPEVFNDQELLEIRAVIELIKKRVGKNYKEVDLKNLQVYINQLNKYMEGDNYGKWMGSRQSEEDKFTILNAMTGIKVQLMKELQARSSVSLDNFKNKGQYKSTMPLNIKEQPYSSFVDRDSKIYILEGEYHNLVDELCAKHEKELIDYTNLQANSDNKVINISQEDIEKKAKEIAKENKRYKDASGRLEEINEWQNMYKAYEEDKLKEQAYRKSKYYKEFEKYSKKNATFLFGKFNQLNTEKENLELEINNILANTRADAEKLLTNLAEGNENAKKENALKDKFAQVNNAVLLELETQIKEIVKQKKEAIKDISKKFDEDIKIQMKIINEDLFSQSDLIKISVTLKQIKDATREAGNIHKLQNKTFLKKLFENYPVYYVLGNKFKKEHPVEWKTAVNLALDDNERGEIYRDILNLENMLSALEADLNIYNNERWEQYNRNYPERTSNRPFYPFAISKKAYEDVVGKDIRHIVTKDFFQYAVDEHCEKYFDKYKKLVEQAAKERDDAVNNIRRNIDKAAAKAIFNNEEYKIITDREKELAEQKLAVQKKYKNDEAARNEALETINNQEAELTRSRNQLVARVLKQVDEEEIKAVAAELKRIQDNYAAKVQPALSKMDDEINNAVLLDLSKRLEACNKKLNTSAQKFYKEEIVGEVLAREEEAEIEHDQNDIAINEEPFVEPVVEDNIYVRDIREKPKTGLALQIALRQEEVDSYESTFYHDKLYDWNAKKEQFDAIMGIYSLLKKNKKTGLTGNSKEYNNLIKELDEFKKGLVEGGWYDAVKNLWEVRDAHQLNNDDNIKLTKVCTKLDRVYKAAEKYMIAKGPENKHWGHGKTRYDLTYLLCTNIYRNGGKVALGKSIIGRMEKELAAGKTEESIYNPEIVDLADVERKYEKVIEEEVGSTRLGTGTRSKIAYERSQYKKSGKLDIDIEVRSDDAKDLSRLASKPKKAQENVEIKEMKLDDFMKM
ncbi:MAG: hypothetical protein E7272_03680 [Pseudobutyrivibrio ruminis]|uniref:Uncharacterized protein n=1 Tax=Pseudobutyrivibrio ruminis TaxID=46206 RepID=A0A927U631_9FIRM|nr:hypothetical protein [Pseudobutyrivibrio ruminis]